VGGAGGHSDPIGNRDQFHSLATGGEKLEKIEAALNGCNGHFRSTQVIGIDFQFGICFCYRESAGLSMWNGLAPAAGRRN
jgi:hypothetical protein